MNEKWSLHSQLYFTLICNFFLALLFYHNLFILNCSLDQSVHQRLSFKKVISLQECKDVINPRQKLITLLCTNTLKINCFIIANLNDTNDFNRSKIKFTFGVCPLTLPARASEPWTLPIKNNRKLIKIQKCKLIKHKIIL